MPPYFRPLRRKIGVVTLVLACFMMVAWMRSYSMLDLLTLATWNSFWRLTIEEGIIEVSRYRTVSGDPELSGPKGRKMSWTSESNYAADGHKSIHGYALTNLAIADTKAEFWGLTYAAKKVIRPTFTYNVSFLYVPHLYVAIPLTLLSTYLLLSKPLSIKQVQASKE